MPMTRLFRLLYSFATFSHTDYYRASNYCIRMGQEAMSSVSSESVNPVFSSGHWEGTSLPESERAGVRTKALIDRGRYAEALTILEPLVRIRSVQANILFLSGFASMELCRPSGVGWNGERNAARHCYQGLLSQGRGRPYETTFRGGPWRAVPPHRLRPTSTVSLGSS